MLVIDATDKLEGIASVADVVEFTCSVVDGTTTGSSEGKLGAGQTQIWNATGVTRILSLTLVNTHTAAVTVNIQKDPTDAGTLYRVMSKDLSLGIGYMAVFDGQRFSVYDASGRPLEGYGAHASDHRAAGADDLLSVPGAIGGTTPAAGAFTTISASGLITATGGQIAFPVTAVPSADPNTLDDYEETEWTPTIDQGATGFTANRANAIKNSGIVVVSCYLSAFLNLDANELRFGGLPFIPINVGTSYWIGQASIESSTTVTDYIYPRVEFNSTVIRMFKNARASFLGNELTGGKAIIFTALYYAD